MISQASQASLAAILAQIKTGKTDLKLFDGRNGRFIVRDRFKRLE